MTKAYEILSKFARVCADGGEDFISSEVSSAAAAALQAASRARLDGAILFVGKETDGSEKYFGSQDAARAWKKSRPGREYRSEELIL